MKHTLQFLTVPHNRLQARLLMSLTCLSLFTTNAASDDLESVPFAVISLAHRDDKVSKEEIVLFVSVAEMRELKLTPEVIQTEIEKLIEAIGQAASAVIAQSVSDLFVEKENPTASSVVSEKPKVDPRVLELLNRGILIESRISDSGKMTITRRLLQVKRINTADSNAE